MFLKSNEHSQLNDMITDSGNNTSQVILIRKSKAKYLLHILISALGLVVVIYTAATENNLFSFLTILFVIGFLAFGLFSLKNLLDKAVQIKMAPDGITLGEGACLQWKEIKHFYIERKVTNVGRGVNIPKYYLHIETIFSGQVTGYRTEKTIPVSGLEYDPEKIIRLIQLHKRKYY